VLALIINMAVLGVLAAAHPTQTFAAILVLGTKGARANIAAFVAAWIVSLVTIFGLGYLAGGAGGEVTSVTVDVTSAIEIAIGVALGIAAVLAVVRRDGVGSHAGVPPSIVKRMDDLHPPSAAAVGVLVQPWAFTLAASVTAARDSVGGLSPVLALVTYGALSAVPVVAVTARAIRDPRAASGWLHSLRDRLARTSRRTIASVSAVAAIYLIVDGVRTFAGR